MLVCTLDDIVYECMYMAYIQTYQYVPVYTGIYSVYVRRLLSGRMLLCKSRTSAELKLAGVARLIRFWPDWK